MQRLDFLKPKFSGARFNDHTLPLDLLEDISIYEALIFQVAKDVYYEENNTKRVPNGFGQDVSLKLSKIEEGSTLPAIILAASTFFASKVDTLPYFQKAQEKIIHTINAADNDSDISGLLSTEALSYFNRLGKNLREDEVIEFSPDSVQTGRLTQVNRRKIVLASPNASSVESEIHLRGNISALNKDPFQFTIQTKDGIKLPVQVSKELYKTVEQAFLGFEEDKRVAVSCIGVYDKQNKLAEIKDIKSITILDRKDIPTQLEKFIKYEEGWMNGEGFAYSKSHLVWLSNQFDNYFNKDLLLPFTFPTVEGGVQFEWKNQSDDATLEVNLNDKTAYLHYYNSETDDETEKDLDLSSMDGWTELNDILSKYFKAEEVE